MHLDPASGSGDWSGSEPGVRQDLDHVLLVITGIGALWWALSFILGPFWLAVRLSRQSPKDRAIDHWGEL